MESQSLVRVRYEETDQMKVVYHANYLVWFEIGRTDFIRNQLGLTYRELEEKGVLFPVTEVSCRYKIPAKYDDELLIRCHVEEMKGVQLTFSYEILRKHDAVLLSAGSTLHVFTDRDLKPLHLRSKYPHIYNQLRAAVRPKS
jgi:acyl-CoA thioester hydrolase